MCPRRLEELREGLHPHSTEGKGQRGELLAWKTAGILEALKNLCMKDLWLHPKQKRKLLKGFKCKHYLSYLFFVKNYHITIPANLLDPWNDTINQIKKKKVIPASFLISHLESPRFISELPSWPMELLPPDSSLQNKTLLTLYLSITWDRETWRCFLRQSMTCTYENTSQRVKKRKIRFPLFALGFFHTET